jgi:mannose-6-phosphate isomerase-like protein (cupin superfamily)
MVVGNGPPQFPARPRVSISGHDVQNRLSEDDALVANGKMTNGQPLVMQGPYRVTMEWRNASQGNINVDTTDAEIFVILEGAGTLLLGGKLIDPRPAKSFAWEGPTLTSTQVKGAVAYKVTKGDMIMIPPNTPHTVSQVDQRLVFWSMHMPMPKGTPSTSMSRPGAQP